MIDKDGNIAGMSLELGCRKLAVLTSSIILKCVEMERRFRYVDFAVFIMAMM